MAGRRGTSSCACRRPGSCADAPRLSRRFCGRSGRGKGRTDLALDRIRTLLDKGSGGVAASMLLKHAEAAALGSG
jgi:hypothetical protein